MLPGRSQCSTTCQTYLLLDHQTYDTQQNERKYYYHIASLVSSVIQPYSITLYQTCVVLR